VRKEALTLLGKLAQAHAVPGHEDEVRAIFTSELRSCGSLSTDGLGSVFCETGAESPRVLVAGHMDEVGFLVQNITPDGFIQFVTIGGWWEHNLLSQRVAIRTRSGTVVPGVIASRPPHFLHESQRRQVMQVDQMHIDVAALSAAHARETLGIAEGDPIAPESPFTEMAVPGHYMAKAFDNRVGMAATILAGKTLAKEKLPNRLVLCGTVQEEVGLRGAKTAASFARPDVALILEGTPADDSPGFPRHESQGRIGGGVQIRMSDPTAIANPRLARLAIDTARELGIPHQIAVRRSGGTDAGSFHVSGTGVPCLVLGVPARYIHSHNSIIRLDDLLGLVDLVTALVRKLDTAAVRHLTKYL
jgi:putative aminopeptidase FrvX